MKMRAVRVALVEVLWRVEKDGSVGLVVSLSAVADSAVSDP